MAPTARRLREPGCVVPALPAPGSRRDPATSAPMSARHRVSSPAGSIRHHAAIARRRGSSATRCQSSTASAIPRSSMPARRVAAALVRREHRVMSVDLAGIGGSALDAIRPSLCRSRAPTAGHSRHLRAGAEHDDAVAGTGLGRGAGRPRHIHGRECRGLFGLSGLPPGVHCRVPSSWRRAPRRRAWRAPRFTSTRH